MVNYYSVFRWSANHLYSKLLLDFDALVRFLALFHASFFMTIKNCLVRYVIGMILS